MSPIGGKGWLSAPRAQPTQTMKVSFVSSKHARYDRSLSASGWWIHAIPPIAYTRALAKGEKVDWRDPAPVTRPLNRREKRCDVRGVATAAPRGARESAFVIRAKRWNFKFAPRGPRPPPGFGAMHAWHLAIYILNAFAGVVAMYLFTKPGIINERDPGVPS